MDEARFSRALEWATNYAERLPGIEEATSTISSASASGTEKAFASLVLAKADPKAFSARTRLANAASQMGSVAARSNDTRLASTWFGIAYEILAELTRSNARFQRSRDYCAEGLRRAGVENPDDFDFASELSLPDDDPELDWEGESEAVEVPDASQPATRPIQNPSYPEVDPGASSTVEPTDEGSDSGTAEELVVESGVSNSGSGGVPDHDAPLESLATAWHGEHDGLATLRQFREHLTTMLFTSPTIVRALHLDTSGDFDFLAVLLEKVDMGTNPQEIQWRARRARELALGSRIGRDPEVWIRRRWLAAGFWNYVLWKHSWPTNEPQCSYRRTGLLGLDHDQSAIHQQMA